MLSFKKDFTLVTGIEPAIRFSPDLPPRDTIHFLPNDHINTRLGASPPTNVKYQQLLTYKPFKASQEWVICLEKPSFSIEGHTGN